jgi:large subunit ribosomal protein L25
MSNKYALAATKRSEAGKGVARKLRRENRIPAVIYGDNKTPEMISLPIKEITLEYLKGHMYTNLCELDVEGKKTLTIVRDIQVHAVTDKIESADFLRVGPNTRVAVEVPVHFVNEEKCPGIKNKGVLNIVHHTIELLCPVLEIPDDIKIDLINLDLGQSIKISAVTLPKGATPVSREKDFTVVTLVAPTEYTENEIVAPKSDAEIAAAKAAADPKAAAKAPAKKK